MTRRSVPFRQVLLNRLANPEVARHYLNEALDESPESFLEALKTVAQARQMVKVAKDAGVQRETLYRSLSVQGNPTFETLSSILKAVGLKINIGIEGAIGALPTEPASEPEDLPNLQPVLLAGGPLIRGDRGYSATYGRSDESESENRTNIGELALCG